ncbi:MAG: adenosine deaminase [Anaerolineales bacterium]|nr:adenosine deaminase [Anaerolineales bacterium]
MMNLLEYARRIPKAELHVHLEGAIRPAILLQLAERNGLPLPARNAAELQDFYRYRDFAHFIRVYESIIACLRTEDDYRLIAYEFGAECARLNVRYAEVTFTIETNMRLNGLPWETILENLNSGREQARREFGVEVRWIFDIVRNLPQTQEMVLEIALAARERGCVALGLGGSEADFPGQLFEDTFERARRACLPRVPHAGENAGPDSVWQALDGLHANRLQHGVRAAEDLALVRALAERQIACDICPTSNIRLGVYPDFEAHPLRQLWEAGVCITIGSDDPPMFNTDLNQEYCTLVERFGFTASELEQVSLNGLRASLLPEAEKARLESEFQKDFARLRQELR